MKTQFITNEKGERIAVILPIEEYKKLLEKLEDIEDIKLYDKLSSKKQTFEVAEEAFKEVEKLRKNRLHSLKESDNISKDKIKVQDINKSFKQAIDQAVRENKALGLSYKKVINDSVVLVKPNGEQEVEKKAKFGTVKVEKTHIVLEE